jgi:hypothetical protein
MRLTPTITGFIVLAAALAAADPPGDEATNRRLLKLWQGDPVRMERLRRHVAAFQSLPAARQEQLRALDRELHQLPEADRDRLKATLERYAGWRSRLDPADRARLDAAPPGPDRARVVDQILDRQWQDSLHKADKDRLAKAAPDERPRILEDIRREEKARRDLRASARRTVDEVAQLAPLGLRLDEFRDRVLAYVDETLRPLATPAEDVRLNNLARLNMVRWLQTVHDMAAGRAPLPFPGPAPPGKKKAVRGWKDVPPEIADKFPSPTPPAIVAADGKWPEFALALTAVARERGIDLPANAFGPTKAEELPPAARRFVTTELTPRCTDDDKKQLAAAEGRWPEYPRMVAALAAKHKLSVPGLALPGTPEQWQVVLSGRQGKAGKAVAPN